MAPAIALPLVLLLVLPAWSHAVLPRCRHSVDSGFRHPGIYHDCPSLDRIQANINSGEPAYQNALDSAVARLPAMQNSSSWQMAGPSEKVNFGGEDGHNIELQDDGKSAYALALGWYGTGNDLWLSRAKEVIFAWALTLKILNEQIQGGEGIAYMTAAAEILRASAASSGWSTANTTNYLTMIEAISAPWNETEGLTRNDFFMNQGFYGNSGAMALAVFSNNRTVYDDMVYHASVGANPDPTLDYAVPIQISGNPEYYGQVTEMGRDQAHPMGTLRGLAFLGLTTKIQHGVDIYAQNSSRLIAGWEYWSKYNLNQSVPWEPKQITEGGSEIYEAVNATARARNYATYEQPLECIGVAYHEYFRRGRVHDIPLYTEYMKWMGVGWDTYEWGDHNSVRNLGFL